MVPDVKLQHRKVTPPPLQNTGGVFHHVLLPGLVPEAVPQGVFANERERPAGAIVVPGDEAVFQGPRAQVVFSRETIGQACRKCPEIVFGTIRPHERPLLESVMCADPVGLPVSVIQGLAHQVKDEVIFLCAVDGGQMGILAVALTRHLSFRPFHRFLHSLIAGVLILHPALETKAAGAETVLLGAGTPGNEVEHEVEGCPGIHLW